MLAYVSRVDLPIGKRCKTRQENYFIEVCTVRVGKGDATIRELQILVLSKNVIFLQKAQKKVKIDP